tara:strand:+ start:297 stop:425 length:129 start_codon:yes stop_codon:yes gene_type:complete
MHMVLSTVESDIRISFYGNVYPYSAVPVIIEIDMLGHFSTGG